MKHRNLIPKMSAGVILFAVVYVLIRTTQVRPSMDDFGDQIDWDVVFIQFLPSVTFFANLILAVYRSLKAKDYVWTFAVILLMPLSLWYTLFVNKGQGSNNSSKPTPLRGAA